jgi:hypothetical protein
LPPLPYQELAAFIHNAAAAAESWTVWMRLSTGFSAVLSELHQAYAMAILKPSCAVCLTHTCRG